MLPLLPEFYDIFWSLPFIFWAFRSSPTWTFWAGYWKTLLSITIIKSLMTIDYESTIHRLLFMEQRKTNWDFAKRVLRSISTISRYVEIFEEKTFESRSGPIFSIWKLWGCFCPSWETFLIVQEKFPVLICRCWECGTLLNKYPYRE